MSSIYFPASNFRVRVKEPVKRAQINETVVTALRRVDLRMAEMYAVYIVHFDTDCTAVQLHAYMQKCEYEWLPSKIDTFRRLFARMQKIESQTRTH